MEEEGVLGEESFEDDFMKEFDITDDEFEREHHYQYQNQPVAEQRDGYSREEDGSTSAGVLDSYKSLFDMSTVEGINDKGTIIQSEVLHFPRVVLGGYGKDSHLSVAEDTMISYSEVKLPPKHKILQSSRSDQCLTLHLRKGCGYDKGYTDHFSVPSLRLDVQEEKEYIEPIRDREKIWTLDSQRDMLTGETPEAALKEKRALKLGLYPRLPPNPALQWSPTLQTLLRKRRIMRTAIVISDTHCFVDIYGIGVSGRVLAPGAPTSRMLLIEAYSVWDSTKYTMQVAVPLLKSLLIGQEHLFLPGKKMQLMKALLRLLYFDYTISYEEERVLVPQSVGGSGGSRNESHSRRNSRISAMSDSLSGKNNQGDANNEKRVVTARLNEEGSNEVQVERDEDIDTEEIEEDGKGDEFSVTETCVSSLLSRPGSRKRRESRRTSVGNNKSQPGSRPESRATAESGGTARTEQDEKEASEKVTHTYRVSHLDKFRLPDTFPQSIADIIRANSTKTELLDMNCPKLTQHLKISPIVRENGPIVRRREAEEKARLDALEEERKRREWADIPKRYKGFFASVTRRKYGKWVIMSLYRMPKKPTILMVKGFCPIECVSVPHFLDLKLLGKLFGVKAPPSMWTNQTIKQVLQSASQQLELREGDERLALLISHPISSGPATQLSPHKSCIGFEKRRSVMVERRRVLPASDPLIPNIPLYEDRQYSTNVPKIGVHSRKKRRLYTGDTLNNHLRHRRDIGKKGIRVAQRGKKIGHVHGIYTLYVTSNMNHGPIASFEELEDEIINKKYSNQVIPPHLAPEFEITIEIYFPINPTYCARNNENSIDFGEGVSSGPVTMLFVLNRRDLCRLVADKRHLRYCLRIGHGFSYEHASEDEVAEMELSWLRMMNYILGRCRWRRGHRPEGMDSDLSLNIGDMDNSLEDQIKLDADQPHTKTHSDAIVTDISVNNSHDKSTFPSRAYQDKVEKAIQLMNVYAFDTSSNDLLINPDKMITPLPPMKGPPLPPVTQDQVVDAFADDYVGDDVDFASITGDTNIIVEADEVAEKTVQELEIIEPESHEVIMLDKSNELVLSLPLCIFNKTCRIYSDVVRRPNVFLQVMMWQRGIELGIVAFDHELNDVYFVRPSLHQQKILCDELEPAGVTEMSINMTVFAMSLIYEEKEFDLVTGEEVDVTLRVLESEAENSIYGSDTDDGDERKRIQRKNSDDEASEPRKADRVEHTKTRVQGFLTLAEENPLDQEGDFVDVEEPDFGKKEDTGDDDDGGDDMEKAMETAGEYDDEIDFDN